MLREVDPRTHRSEPEPLDENACRLLVLSVLLEDRDPDLAVLQQYIRMQTPPLTRMSCRRAWNLSEQLAHLVQEYEYHRQDLLIQPWLRGQLGLSHTEDFYRVMERAQRTLFTNITREDDGKRTLLSENSGRNFKTLPQYAMELMEQPLAVRPNRMVHVFGTTQTTELYARLLSWLGEAFDIRVYHLNVLAGQVPDRPSAASLHSIVQKNREPAHGDQGNELLRLWGRAGAESLGLMAELLASGNYGAEVLEPVAAQPMLPTTTKMRAKKPAPTVLSCLHDHLLGRPAGVRRLAQDTSVQIVGCPGIVREVETVYNSILDNLHQNAALRQTDVAVLVTDMPRYRPILQAVFERPPRRLQYNLVDFSAAGLSMLGQALLGMLDLALESFTRSRVFAVLLNPCFLARLGVDRTAALTWLEWAETLGICQGWDAAEKQEQGYPRSPFYAWRLALQRLRLGRYMEVTAEDADEPAPRFGHVIPFADIQSADREQLDAFCRAVESLLPRLARLRHQSTSGQRWAADLQRLVQDFLDIPADRPEEEQVRTEVLAAVERLALWDHLRAKGGPSTGLPLALVREYMQTQLEGLAGNHGEYLTGGVTLAALQPMRPVPFPVLYVIGLDADTFPGSNALSSFDLRGVQREHGDMRPAEEKTYVLLENLLAAQQKIYLLYNNRDAQKDLTLLPSMPLQQLQRYLGDRVTREPFETVAMPPFNDDDAFFNQAQQPEYQDVLVQYRGADRFIALSAAARAQRLALDLHQQAELQAKADTLRVDFAIAPEPRPAAGNSGHHLGRRIAAVSLFSGRGDPAAAPAH